MFTLVSFLGSVRRAAGFGLVLGVLAHAAQADRLTVFAAASAKTALDQAALVWEEQTGHQVIPSYSGSATLARQIQAGAPADMFLSANTLWMDVIEQSGLLVPESRHILFGNQLVLIAHGVHDAIAPEDLAALLGDQRLAMGLVNAVPAGIYGKAAFTALGLWDDLAPRVAQTDSVRAALTLVASGEAPFGVVYLTDAGISDDVTIVHAFDPALHPEIAYPLAIVDGGNTALAQDFAGFLAGSEAKEIFESLGFVVSGDQK